MMTDTTDTSAERAEVERLLADLDWWNDTANPDEPPVVAAAKLRALLARAEKAEAERDRAVEARTEAIKIMADMSRQAGSWQGIAEGKDVVIRQLEAEQDRLRAAILDTAPHDAGLVPMRLRLMAKGETPITDPTPGGWSVALACELEAAYYGGADRGPPTVNVRWLQVANHVAALVEAARREGEAREREACKALARDISPPSHIGLGDALGFCEACEHIAAAIRARGDA